MICLKMVSRIRIRKDYSPKGWFYSPNYAKPSRKMPLRSVQYRSFCSTSLAILHPDKVNKLAFHLGDERLSNLLEIFRNQRSNTPSKSVTLSEELLQRVTELEDRLADIDRQMEQLRNDFPEFSPGTETPLATTDSELAKMVEEDVETLEKDRRRFQRTLLSELAVWLLYGRGETENENPKDVIMEVSAGVGGQEAMLFTKEIFDMYQRYAAYRNWKFDVLEDRTTDLDGLHFASASISGDDAYMRLRFEGGVHRVQRVPATERNGRVHTSTMSVAILAQPPPSDGAEKLNMKELRFESFRACAPGGQNVNKSESGCRVIHLPTGITVTCQMERQAQLNREWALRRLAAILYDKKVDAEVNARQRARKLQIGSLARSEKIRTYNYPQDRVTDHRTKHSFVGIPETLAGGDGLDRIIDSVLRFHLDERLSEALDEELKKWKSEEKSIEAT